MHPNPGHGSIGEHVRRENARFNMARNSKPSPPSVSTGFTVPAAQNAAVLIEWTKMKAKLESLECGNPLMLQHDGADSEVELLISIPKLCCFKYVFEMNLPIK